MNPFSGDDFFRDYVAAGRDLRPDVEYGIDSFEAWVKDKWLKSLSADGGPVMITQEEIQELEWILNDLGGSVRLYDP